MDGAKYHGKSPFVTGVHSLRRLYIKVYAIELAADVDDASNAVMEQVRQVDLEAQKVLLGGVTVGAEPAEMDMNNTI